MLRVAEQYAGTDTGRQRRANEDSLLARAPLFVVADGMGGAQAGEVASRIAVEAFQPGLPDASRPRARAGGASRARPTRASTSSRAPNAEQAGMGTTLTAAYVGEQEVAIAHVGDSRAYCLRDGRAAAPDRRPLARRRAAAPGPAHARGGGRASAALGHHARARPRGRSSRSTRAPFAARAGDVYLLCSDGLTTMISEEQIAATLNAHRAPARRGRGADRRRQRRPAAGTTSPSCCSAWRRCQRWRRRRRRAGARHGRRRPGRLPPRRRRPPRRHPPTPPAVAVAGSAAEHGAGGNRRGGRRRGGRRRGAGETPDAAHARGRGEPRQAARRRRADTARGRARVRARGARADRLRRLPGAAVGVLHRDQRRGLVTLYEGLPYRLPGGLTLYSSRVRLRCQRLDAQPRTPAHAARTTRCARKATPAALIRSLELEQLE